MEVDVALGHVGVTGVDQIPDQLHDRADRLGGQRLVVGPAELQAVGVGDVGGGHLPRQLVAGDPLRPRRVVDLVVDVGDVGYERHVQALVLEEPLQQQEDDVWTGVAHVDRPVDGGAAHVDAHPARVPGLQRQARTGAGVVEDDPAHAGTLAGFIPAISGVLGVQAGP